MQTEQDTNYDESFLKLALMTTKKRVTAQAKFFNVFYSLFFLLFFASTVGEIVQSDEKTKHIHQLNLVDYSYVKERKNISLILEKNGSLVENLSLMDFNMILDNIKSATTPDIIVPVVSKMEQILKDKNGQLTEQELLSFKLFTSEVLKHLKKNSNDDGLYFEQFKSEPVKKWIKENKNNEKFIEFSKNDISRKISEAESYLLEVSKDIDKIIVKK